MQSRNQEKWAKERYDLRDLIKDANLKFSLEAIFIFGSRRHKTRSLRSDIDLFFVPKSFIKPADIRIFIEKTCKALDIFILERGRAVSAINESYIELADNISTITATDALILWSEDDGLNSSAEIDWVQEYASYVDFASTVMPNLVMLESVEQLKSRLSHEGLPTDPVIGESEDEVARRLVSIARAISEFTNADFPGKGSARNSFVVSPASEYDFQDLFWIAIKPWVGGIGRERTEIVFDKQSKKSDFSLSRSRFIVEMKLAKTTDDVRAIVKTLDGLANFYSENANVRYVLFVIYAKRAAAIDRTAWESRYSNQSSLPRISVNIIEVD